jgi:hypothetical protein
VTESDPVLRDSIEQQVQVEWQRIVPDLLQETPSADAIALDGLRLALRELQLCTLDESEISEERLHAAGRLAIKLVDNPTRTLDMNTWHPQQGLLSPNALQSGPVSIFRQAQGTADQVAFTYGTPYIFNTFTQVEQQTAVAIAVLRGEEILTDRQPKIATMDSGLLYSYFNPLSKFTMDLLARYPEQRPTPLALFYEHVLQVPEHRSIFRQYMDQALTRYSVPPVHLRDYLTHLLAGAFPLQDDDITLANNWRGTYAPEGTVKERIPIEDVHTLIVSEEKHDFAQNVTRGTDVRVINAGRVQNATNLLGEQLSNVHLLQRYVEAIGATELEPFTDLLLAGHVPSPSIFNSQKNHILTHMHFLGQAEWRRREKQTF